MTREPLSQVNATCYIQSTHLVKPENRVQHTFQSAKANVMSYNATQIV